jgi:AraC-like DNA-binding protein
MDVLSAVLRELRFEVAGYRRLELGAPWGLAFAQAGLRGLHIVVEGRCELVMDGYPTLPLQAGDLVVAPRADPHGLRSPGASPEALIPPRELARLSEGGRIRAGADGAPATVVCGAFVFHEAIHPALAALPRIIHVPGEDGRAPGWLAAYIDVLTAETFEQGPGSEMVMARLSEALVARALRFHVERAEEPGWLRGLGDPGLARALGAMHQDFGKPWTLEALARTAGLSRAAFAARFAGTVGATPMRYLLGCRMRRAMTMLRDEGATLAEVAEAVGYGSEAALSAAFKRHAGVAPGAFRRAAAA